MHDGRFATLEQVLDHYNEGIKTSSTLSPLILEANNIVYQEKTTINKTIIPIKTASRNKLISHQQPSLNLNQAEKKAIIAFLKTLTDRQFIQDKRFSNPFLKDNQNES